MHEHLNHRDEDGLSSHWHLDKRLNVGHLIITALFATSMFAWAATLDKRISANELKIDNVTNMMNNSEERSIKAMESMSSNFNRMNDKLDRLIERN